MSTSEQNGEPSSPEPVLTPNPTPPPPPPPPVATPTEHVEPPFEPRFKGPSPRGSYLLAAGSCVLAVALAFLWNAQAGAVVIGLALLAAGVWRAAKPRTPFAAGLAVRSKGFDLALYFGAGVAIVVLALIVPHVN